MAFIAVFRAQDQMARKRLGAFMLQCLGHDTILPIGESYYHDGGFDE